MIEKDLMIDYRDEHGTIRRKVIDDMEFCVRDGDVYFISETVRYCIPLDKVIQVYPN